MADNQIRTYTYTQNFVKYFNFVCMENFVYHLRFVITQLLVLAALVDIVLFVLIWCAY